MYRRSANLYPTDLTQHVDSLPDKMTVLSISTVKSATPGRENRSRLLLMSNGTKTPILLTAETRFVGRELEEATLFFGRVFAYSP